MNSNKHVNETLRQEYRDSTGDDEIAFELGIVFRPNHRGAIHVKVGSRFQGHEINHAFTNPRWDLWSNLIRLSVPTHRWFHTYLNEGRILCLLGKAEKSKRLCDPRDFNLSELAVCRPNLAGWVESVELEPFVEPYRARLLELIAEKAKEKFVSDDLRTRTVFTVGDVAKACKVSNQTVCKWYDSGRLRGYRVPGTQDRRIPRDYLIEFLKAHGLPTDDIEPAKETPHAS